MNVIKRVRARSRGITVATLIVAGVIAGLLFASSSLFASQGQEPVRFETTSPVEAMSVFEKPSTEEIPTTIIDDLKAILANAPEGAPDVPGPVIIERARVLLSDVGPEHHSIYAAPTADGEVCEDFTGIMSGCFKGFQVDQPITIDGVGRYPGDSLPSELGGLAKDEVARVDVEVNGESHEATLGANAWYFEVPDDASFEDVTAFDVTLRDGSTLKIPYSWDAPSFSQGGAG